MSASERVAASCPKSKYKDDRHEWSLLMYEGAGVISYRPSAYYALRRCDQCQLTVLLVETEGAFKDAPKREDTIIYAFYPQGDRLV